MSKHASSSSTSYGAWALAGSFFHVSDRGKGRKTVPSGGCAKRSRHCAGHSARQGFADHSQYAFYGFSGICADGSRVAGILPDVRAERRLDPFLSRAAAQRTSHQAWAARPRDRDPGRRCNVGAGPASRVGERFHDTSGTDERCGGFLFRGVDSRERRQRRRCAQPVSGDYAARQR